MSELSDYKRLVVEPDERAMRAKLAGLRGRVEAAEFSLALLLAARAEGPAPVSAPLDREGVARIIDPDGFARREQHLRVSAEWHEKAEKFAATEDPAPYPDGRFAVERIVEAWRGVAEKHATYAETDVRHAYAKADAILALSQQGQVGLTTPAVLGEPSAEAWIEWKGGENPAPGMTVDVALANGSHQLNRSADSLIWEPVKVLPFSAVIAYRVVSPPPPAGGVK